MNDVRTEELKRNILSLSQWVRILYMVFYAIACWLITIILPVIIIAQILISLISGRDNENLRTVGMRVADYFHDMLTFLVYGSETKPWPFNDSDSADTASHSDFEVTPETEPEPEPEPEQEPEAETDSTPASEQSDEPKSEDVFADISFTDSADDSAAEEDVSDADDSASDEPEKKEGGE